MVQRRSLIRGSLAIFAELSICRKGEQEGKNSKFMSHSFAPTEKGEMVLKATPSLGEEQASAQELVLPDRLVSSCVCARARASARSQDMLFNLHNTCELVSCLL